MSENTATEYFEKYLEARIVGEILREWVYAFDKSLQSGYGEIYDDRATIDIKKGKKIAENLIVENRDFIQRMSTSIDQILGSLSDERYVTVIRMNKLEGLSMDEVAAAVGLSRRGTEKMRDRAMKEAEAVYQEVCHA